MENTIVIDIINVFLILLTLAGYWKVFEKAGHKGWKAIIPIYNVIILLRIIGKPWWWVILLIIPLVNIIFMAIIVYHLAKSFEKGGLFAAGIFFFPFIFIPILGFSEARFIGPSSEDDIVRLEPEDTEEV